MVALVGHTEVVLEIRFLQGEGTNSLGNRKIVGVVVRNNNGDVVRKRQGEGSGGLKSGTWRVRTIQFTEERLGGEQSSTGRRHKQGMSVNGVGFLIAIKDNPLNKTLTLNGSMSKALDTRARWNGSNIPNKVPYIRSDAAGTTSIPDKGEVIGGRETGKGISVEGRRCWGRGSKGFVGTPWREPWSLAWARRKPWSLAWAFDVRRRNVDPDTLFVNVKAADVFR